MKAFVLTVLFAFLLGQGFSQTLLSTAVHFDAKDFDGVPHNLTNYLNDGKYVLLSFSTVNCGTCMTFSPHVSQTYQNFGCNNGDVIVLGVNWGATNLQLKQHHQFNNLLFPALSGLEGYGNEIATDYEIQSFISVILIAPNGDIVNQYIFPPSTAVLDSTLTSYGLSPISCFVGTSDLKSEAGLQLYPNPATDYFRIEESYPMDDLNVKLYDLFGRLVKDYGITRGNNQIYSLSGIKPGTYSVIINQAEQVINSRKLIVMPSRF